MHYEIITHEVEIPIRALKYASIYEINLNPMKILVDSGMSESAATYLEKSGLKLDKVDALMITHLHIDHRKRKYLSRILNSRLNLENGREPVCTLSS